MTTIEALTAEQAAALDIARALAAAGIPVFAAWPDGGEATGFKLPTGWQHTRPDPSVVDQWRPGMALAAITGHGLDVLDVDPRNGGNLDALGAALPVSYGAAFTPSGGLHSFIRSLGVRKKTNVFPGIDVQAGDPQGNGRGFVFIAPTVRVSKVDGQPRPYVWAVPPDIPRAVAAVDDRSGATLAAMITGSKASAQGSPPDAGAFMTSGPWANIEATLAEGRNNGVAKLAAALRGRGGWRADDAIAYMRAEVWPLIDQEQGGHTFPLDEFEDTIRAQWRQYPDGKEQREAEAAIPPTPDGPPPNPARYFGTGGGLLGATLATDIITLGPLAEGIDDQMWKYAGGVWRPAKHIVRDRTTYLLGERYKRHCASTAEDIIRARVVTIASEPVGDVVNFRNGLLRWRIGELFAHTPDVLTTVQLGVDYDPAADCPRFEHFLSEVVPADMIGLVWELIGYLMFSGNPLHKAVMLTGKGRNGKGTFLRVMRALLGGQNLTSVSLHDLVNTRFTTASLFGKLANIAGDIDAGYLENTATLKAVTGGDSISAEHKGRDRFDFTPWAVPVFSANKIPPSADTTSGYLSRWLILPFPNSFEGREDRTLDARLTTHAELTGIAVRGIAALPRLLERGDFELTDSGRAASDEFMRRVDQVRTWLADCTVPDPGHWIYRTDIYRAYQTWAARDGHRPVKASEFYDRLEAAGVIPATVHGKRGFKGIRVTDDGGYGGYGAQLPMAPSPTGGSTTEGAEGAEGAAENNHSAQPQQHEQKSSKPAPTALVGAAAPTAESAPQGERDGDHKTSLESTMDPAPNMTSENRTQGAEGADSPHPPVRAHTCRGGYEQLHPLHPTSENGLDQSSADGQSKPKRAPSAKVAERRAAERAAAISAASGDQVSLPAVVDRSGAVRPLSTVDAARIVCDAVNRSGALTVDVETTGFPVGHVDYALRTIQLGDDETAVVFDAADPEQASLAGRLLGMAPQWHAHSATADLVPLAHAGLVDAESAWERMRDTVIPAKLADPASTGSDPGLKQLAGTVLGEDATAPAADKSRAELFKAGKWLENTKVTTPVERSGWAQVDQTSTTMIRYAASDVLDTAALAKRLPELPEQLYERERIAQRMTARVAHVGLPIDGRHVSAKLAEHTAQRERHAEHVKAFGINIPGSDVQVGAKLLDLGAQLPRSVKTGRPSVAAGVLEPLRGSGGELGELVDAVLDFRHHDTAIGTFLEPYQRLVTHGDGRARPTVYTLGADTGRMSCVRPNFQQLPREGGIRAMITADPGHLLIGADFSGVEIRVAAALSGDANLQRIIAEEDAGLSDGLHWMIARQVWGPDATKANRYQAKRIVFGRFYGGGVETLAKQAGVSEPIAQAAIDVLDAIAPGLTAWSWSIRDAIKAGRTQFPAYSGRIIHLPRRAPHAGPNYCIQGTARELLVDALVRWRDTRWGSAVLWPVHDELDAMVPEDDADAATAELVRCMETELFGVQIKVEAAKPAFAWADAA